MEVLVLVLAVSSLIRFKFLSFPIVSYNLPTLPGGMGGGFNFGGGAGAGGKGRNGLHFVVILGMF